MSVPIENFGDGRWVVVKVEYLQYHFIVTIKNTDVPSSKRVLLKEL